MPAFRCLLITPQRYYIFLNCTSFFTFYLLRQIQHQSAKLVEMFEEAFIRCHKIYFFSWSSVDFVLYLHNGIVINSFKINSFRNILSNKFVRMFNVPFLPSAIRVCKVYVSFHHCADDFVFGELCPIVSSYSPNLLSIRKEHPFYILCPFVCVRSQNRIAGRSLKMESDHRPPNAPCDWQR